MSLNCRTFFVRQFK